MELKKKCKRNETEIVQKSKEMALENNNVHTLNLWNRSRKVNYRNVMGLQLSSLTQVTEARLRLFGHVQKRDSVHCSVDPEDGDVGRRKTGWRTNRRRRLNKKQHRHCDRLCTFCPWRRCISHSRGIFSSTTDGDSRYLTPSWVIP